MGINVQGLKTYVYDLKYIRNPRVPECTKLPTLPSPKTPVELTRARIQQAAPLSTMSGPECCENPPTLSSGGESGDVLQIASLNSYVTGNTDSKIAVVLISDVYGTQHHSTL